MKKYQAYIIIVIVIISALMLTMIYKNNKHNNWQERNNVIAHAMGEINGYLYTNSLDAFEYNYSNGFKIFEVDLTLTSDNSLVLKHDWSSSLATAFEQDVPVEKTDIALSINEFKSMKIHNYIEPISFDDLISLMGIHKDMYIVTDTKNVDYETIEKQFKSIVEGAKKYDKDILKRIIPQIYNEDMYHQIETIYKFDSYIYTLYQTNATEDEVIAFMTENNIKVVAMPEFKISEEFLKKLKENEICVYMHTINTKQEVQKFTKMGVNGFYTDYITPSYYNFIVD